MLVPTETRMGSTVVAPGASFCNSARVPATTTLGDSFAVRKRHIVRIREPMVNTAGLTLSKGNVSHDGKNSTASGPRKEIKSSAIDCAIVPVGAATMTGRRDVLLMSAARTVARATSGTASTASRLPAIASMPGSVRAMSVRLERGAVESLTVR
ncbi:unannotated protein [freshwater metagenome]|uniref:Unannotated protein n=1 Tax=freshwater metagenome TaxID=449393 RepID=A0A6J7P873_9ZZZZ